MLCCCCVQVQVQVHPSLVAHSSALEYVEAGTAVVVNTAEGTYVERAKD